MSASALFQRNFWKGNVRLSAYLTQGASILAWTIPGTEEPGGLPSVGSHRVGQDWSNLAAAMIVTTVLNWKQWIFGNPSTESTFSLWLQSVYMHCRVSARHHIWLEPGSQIPNHAKVKVKLLSCARLFVTPWTVAYHAPLSMGFSRQEYWSGLPFPSPGDLPDAGIEPGSPAL